MPSSNREPPLHHRGADQHLILDHQRGGRSSLAVGRISILRHHMTFRSWHRHANWRCRSSQYTRASNPLDQPAHHSVSPRDLGYVRAFFETLGDNPRLLLGRPPAPPTLPSDQFDPAIRPVFLPGIKHGTCDRVTSNDQLMPGCIAGDSREGQVRRSCRLRSNRRVPICTDFCTLGADINRGC